MEIQRHVAYMIGQVLWAAAKLLKDLLEESLRFPILATGVYFLWNATVPDIFGLVALTWFQSLGLVLLGRLLIRTRPLDLDVEMSPQEKEAYEQKQAEEEERRRREEDDDDDRPFLRVIKDD